MRKSGIRITVCLTVAILMVFTLIGCGSNTGDKNVGSVSTSTDKNVEASTTNVDKEPVKITYPTYRIGTSVGAPLEKALLDEFKQKYGKEVEIVVEEIPTDSGYVDKLKVLAASGDVPDVFECKGGLRDIYINAGLAVDLMPYLNEDADWKEDISADAINYYTVDGKIYNIPNAKGVSGYFYNKEMFNKVGIKPAATWDEFFSNCEKLKAANITPLSLATGENAWTANLFLGSIVGTSSEAGNKFMNTKNQKDYNTPEFIDGIKKVLTMFQKYTTKDAIGGLYANAANNFLQGKTAMIANGSWMISDFSDKTKAPEGFDKKVGCTLFPNGGEYVDYQFGYMVCSKDKEKLEAAIKMVKFWTGLRQQQLELELLNTPGLSPKLTISDEFKQKNPILAELLEADKSAKYRYQFIDSISYPNVMDSFQRLYPELIFNKATPEEMAKKLTEVAGKN